MYATYNTRCIIRGWDGTDKEALISRSQQKIFIIHTYISISNYPKKKKNLKNLEESGSVFVVICYTDRAAEKD